MRCLVVDDNPDDRSLVERMLTMWGYRSTCVSSGTAALTAVGQESFDIAIVDLGMPGMSGVETLRALKGRDARMRLLVVTAFQDARHVIEALDAGANGYLMKDELGSRLGTAIQEVLGGQSPLSARAGSHILRFIAQSRAEASSPPVAAAAPAVVAPAVAAPDVPPPKTQPRPKIPEPKHRLADASGEIEIDVALGKREPPEPDRS
jgi:DNA-binding response OmpR family regulator